MKKIFTLICALVGLTSAANAASVSDLAVCKHSYVLVADDWNNNGTEKIVKNALFGDDFFFSPTGNDKATNKGSVNLADAETWGEEIASKYGEYGTHLNSMRVKNAQDVFAMSVTAKSKVIIFYNGQNKVGTAARYPKIATNAALTEGVQNPGPTEETGTVGIDKLEWIAPDDMTIYVGSYNGDTYISYVIVEANEAPGTPMVKVGPQTYENGLWYRTVTCTPVAATEEGSTEQIPTIVTYTTDGSAPTAASPVYKEPLKCYADQTIKFQAYLDFGTGAEEDLICDGADNEAIVNFQFNAPSIQVEGANVTVVSEYEGAKNYVSYLDQTDVETSSLTLTESATLTAYTKIQNGSYATFTTKSTAKDVLVLNPIKEKKVITVTAADVVEDAEATANSTTGPVYKVENGAISADKMDFFVKNLEFAVVKDAQYQIDGKEAYIKMNATNITFTVAEGDSVNVKVICSKNSCKDITAADKEDGSVPAERQCFVNVSGTNYGGADLANDPEGNVITFGLAAGTYTFQKYSGTGNILISSIEITPAVEQPAEPVVTEVALVEGHTLLVSDLEAAGATDESIVTFYIVNEAGESREGWGIGGFANSDNWSPIVLWTGVAGDAWTYEHTFAEIKEVAGDTPGEWHGIGITINIYNGCKVEKVTLTNSASGINTVANDTAAKVSYNLMGQKTNATSGLMIRGGKIVIIK